MTARIRSGASLTGKSRIVVFGHGLEKHTSRCIRLAAAVSLAALLLGGCKVGPKYVRPTADVPPQYKEAGNWMPAQPSDAISKGQWWRIYGDPQPKTLNDFQLPLDVSYEPDVWGRVRRSVEAARSEAQATAADLASTDLSLHA